jgi:hypothetical protein
MTKATTSLISSASRSSPSSVVGLYGFGAKQGAADLGTLLSTSDAQQRSIINVEEVCVAHELHFTMVSTRARPAHFIAGIT